MIQVTLILLGNSVYLSDVVGAPFTAMLSERLSQLDYVTQAADGSFVAPEIGETRPCFRVDV